MKAQLLTTLGVINSNVQPYRIFANLWANKGSGCQPRRYLPKDLIGLKFGPSIFAGREILFHTSGKVRLQGRGEEAKSGGQSSLNDGVVKSGFQNEVETGVFTQQIMFQCALRVCDRGGEGAKLLEQRYRKDYDITIVADKLESLVFELRDASISGRTPRVCHCLLTCV